MLIVGLTGSIGMGKSTAAGRFREHGIAVCDADAIVHELYSGEAAAVVEAAFPGVTRHGQIDRSLLAQALQADPARYRRLEAIVHPLVRAREAAFLRGQHAAEAQCAVLEIPLLFETDADAGVDVTVVVSASAETQRARVLARPGMTTERFQDLLARQLPDLEKRSRADFIVDSNGSIAEAAAQVDAIVGALHGRSGTAYARVWADI